jgi:hypothetical protein
MRTRAEVSFNVADKEGDRVVDALMHYYSVFPGVRAAVERDLSQKLSAAHTASPPLPTQSVVDAAPQGWHGPKSSAGRSPDRVFRAQGQRATPGPCSLYMLLANLTKRQGVPVSSGKIFLNLDVYVTRRASESGALQSRGPGCLLLKETRVPVLRSTASQELRAASRPGHDFTKSRAAETWTYCR